MNFNRGEILNTSCLIITSNVRGGRKTPPYDSLSYAIIQTRGGENCLQIFPEFLKGPHPRTRTLQGDLAKAIVEGLPKHKIYHHDMSELETKLRSLLFVATGDKSKTLYRHLEELNNQRREPYKKNIESELEKLYRKEPFLRKFDIKYEQGLSNIVQKFLEIE